MAKKRRAGTGSIRKRPDGRYEGRAVIGYDENGLPKTKNVLARTKAECEEKLKALIGQIEAEKKKSEPEIPQTTNEITFGEWLDRWYQTFSKPFIRATTRQCYEDRIYKHIIPEIGSIQLKNLTQNDLQQFYARLKTSGRVHATEKAGNTLSDRMVRGCHATCHSALAKAVELGILKENPSEGCKLPPKQSAEMQYLAQDEVQRFLLQAKEDGYFEIFMLDLATGLRRGELMALQWKDINFKTGELKVQRQVYRADGQLQIVTPKTKNSARTILLPDGILKMLKEMKKKNKSRWAFPSPVKEDFPRDPQKVYQKLKQVLERAECKQIRFHDLRHTFATIAIQNGMDIKTLASILRHRSSLTTLSIYTHITDSMQETAAQNIDRSIACSVPCPMESPDGDATPETAQNRTVEPFQPRKRKRRKAGTGYLKQIGENLWEGRYSPKLPDGTRWSKNVYGKTEEECEEKLKVLIREMKTELERRKKN